MATDEIHFLPQQGHCGINLLQLVAVNAFGCKGILLLLMVGGKLFGGLLLKSGYLAFGFFFACGNRPGRGCLLLLVPFIGLFQSLVAFGRFSFFLLLCSC